MSPHKVQPPCIESDESGFTIIESLVAIVVVAILLSAIAPVIVLSTATRVQAKRIEKATQAAKAFVDAVRAKTIADPSIDVTLESASASNIRTLSGSTSDYLLSTVAVPTKSTGLYCYKKDGSIIAANCTSDLFYIQAVRIAVKDSDPDKGEGYRLGIRVYRADAEFGSLTKASDTDAKTQATFTAGLGTRKSPLLETTTEIVRGQSSYNALCARLGGCQP